MIFLFLFRKNLMEFILRFKNIYPSGHSEEYALVNEFINIINIHVGCITVWLAVINAFEWILEIPFIETRIGQFISFYYDQDGNGTDRSEDDNETE